MTLKFTGTRKIFKNVERRKSHAALTQRISAFLRIHRRIVSCRPSDVTVPYTASFKSRHTCCFLPFIHYNPQSPCILLLQRGFIFVWTHKTHYLHKYVGKQRSNRLGDLIVRDVGLFALIYSCFRCPKRRTIGLLCSCWKCILEWNGQRKRSDVLILLWAAVGGLCYTGRSQIRLGENVVLRWLFALVDWSHYISELREHF